MLVEDGSLSGNRTAAAPSGESLVVNFTSLGQGVRPHTEATTVPVALGASGPLRGLLTCLRCVAASLLAPQLRLRCSTTPTASKALSGCDATRRGTSSQTSSSSEWCEIAISVRCDFLAKISSRLCGDDLGGSAEIEFRRCGPTPAPAALYCVCRSSRTTPLRLAWAVGWRSCPARALRTPAWLRWRWLTRSSSGARRSAAAGSTVRSLPIEHRPRPGQLSPLHSPMRQLTATLCPRRSSATRTNVTVARTNFTSCKATGPSGDGSSDALPDGGGAAALTNSTAVISASAFNLNVAVVCGAVSSPFPAHHRK